MIAEIFNKTLEWHAAVVPLFVFAMHRLRLLVVDWGGVDVVLGRFLHTHTVVIDAIPRVGHAT